jgi:hypothetical protein
MDGVARCMVGDAVTVAHFQTVTLNTRLREWIPEHEPRERDPHYKLFHAAKRRMRELDIPCWRCGVRYEDLVAKGEPATEANPLGAYQLEAHHADLEFSLLNAIDIGKWWGSSTREDAKFMVESFSNVDGWLHRHPEFHAKPHDEIFLAYMESEGNLQQLCDVCHRSKEQGIHHIPYPDWRARAVWRVELPAHIQDGS